MTDINNKLNLSNVHNTYTHGIKRDEIKTALSNEISNETAIQSESKISDSYGRILVKQPDKADNTDMVKRVRDSIDFFVSHPKLAAAAVKASDDAFDILSADEASNAYENACLGIIDAAYERA